MLKMKKVLGKAFGIDNSKLEEIPHMHNYYKKGFKEELRERRAAAKVKRKEQEEKEDD